MSEQTLPTSDVPTMSTAKTTNSMKRRKLKPYFAHEDSWFARGWNARMRGASTSMIEDETEVCQFMFFEGHKAALDWANEYDLALPCSPRMIVVV